MGDSSVAPAGALVPSVPKPEHAPSAGDAAVQLQALAAAAADDECAGASPSSSPGEGEGAGAAAEGADAAGDRDLLCPICMALIKDAFLTACGHSFCYMCIVTHLNHKSDCPCCANYLTKAQLYPNFLLDKVVKKMSARQVAKTASPIDQFRHVVQQGNDMTVKELDSLMTLIAEKKRQMEQQESETNMQILLVFLHCLRKQKLEELNEIQTDLQYIKDDISSVERHRLDLYRTKERYSMRLRMLLDEPAASKMWPSPMDKPNSAFVPNSRAPPSTSSPGGLNNRRFDLRAPASHQGHQRRDALASSDPPNPPIQSGNVIARKRRVQAQFNELQEYYLQRRRTGAQSHRQEDVVAMNREGYHEGLEDFQSVLTTFTRYSRLRVIAELRHGDLFHSANIVSSIEFDRDDELFATAGVSKRIKVFEFSTVVNEPSDVHCPVVEMATRSKLSCLSWNKYSKNVIASSDYEGIVTVWDVQTRQSVMEYEEHEKRAWSVDFSRTEPKMLVSGSDDCKVKVWCTNQEASAINIDMKANICSVKYNPGSSYYVAVGSADHHIHYFDLRNPSAPLHVFGGHKKAVSYVKFLSNNELASASTDSTLRLWDVKDNCPLRTFRGHKNEKNFVGLSVNNEYIACGSETNEVFVYHKAISKPASSHRFLSTDLDDAEDDPGSYFISAVCWKSDSPTMLTANSQGTIKVLVLAP
ncbi:E3 ubiquitin-protein ligase COP1 [Aegilops tauschii subsp. strangulata]|uniref:E3 ubiquitin-protein ligase COP1 n=1 Tax=Aegilops tauschii subsp. strangulata TaxID=200361 RepID=UPI00098AE40F|nr:E3 ubiquitin-protein ligase COP1 [Aegilops tauschii subsp. strangulata]